MGLCTPILLVPVTCTPLHLIGGSSSINGTIQLIGMTCIALFMEQSTFVSWSPIKQKGKIHHKCRGRHICLNLWFNFTPVSKYAHLFWIIKFPHAKQNKTVHKDQRWLTGITDLTPFLQMRCKSISREEQLCNVCWCWLWSGAVSCQCKVRETRAIWASACYSLARLGLGIDLRFHYYPHKLRNCCCCMASRRAECEAEEEHNRKDIVF